MFAKILQNNQLSSQEQKQVLKSIIQVNLKQNLPEVKLQLNHNYQKLKPVLIKQWKYALRIAFPLFSWQAARDFIQGKRQGAAFDLITSIAKEADLKSLEYFVLELFKVYSNHWKNLVILSVVSQIASQRIAKVEDYSWFLAGFIKISAGIIQGYLSIRNEPTKSHEDRIDEDLVLVQNCEKWVTNSYISLFNNIKLPKTQVQKKIVLSALSQIIGALYESQRQGHLKAELLHKIQDQASIYLFKSYRIDEIYDMFLDRLTELNYSNPIKKIDIPQKYTQKTQLQTQGICWIINRYIQQSNQFYSTQKLLDYSLVVYSQILPLPYKLKQQLLVKIRQFLESTKPSPQFQIRYPFGLLLFNIYHFHKLEFSSLSQKLGFQHDKIVKINRFKRLLGINIENLNVQKIQFVVSHLDEDNLNLKQSLFLIKAIQFNFVNQELSKSITTLFQKISKAHDEQGRKIVLRILDRERLHKRNIQLCQELSKLYAK